MQSFRLRRTRSCKKSPKHGEAEFRGLRRNRLSSCPPAMKKKCCARSRVEVNAEKYASPSINKATRVARLIDQQFFPSTQMGDGFINYCCILFDCNSVTEVRTQCRGLGGRK